MTTIQTAPNILTTVLITFSGYNDERKRWEIVYTVTRNDLVGGNTFPPVRSKTIVIPLDDMVEFFASFSGFDTFLAVCYARVIEFEGIVEWDGTVIDDITNDPNADAVAPWQPNQLVAPPNRRSYEGKVYGVIQAHTTQAQWTPDLAPALFNFMFNEGDGGGGLLPWVQPTGAQDAYAIGAQVTHSGQCWESTIAANTTTPEETAFNWWIVITCP